MKADEINKVVELVSDKIKELGPAGEVAIDDVVGYISVSAQSGLILGFILLIFFIIICWYSWSKLLKTKQFEREEFHPLWVSSALCTVGVIISFIEFVSKFSSKLAAVIHPLGYFIQRLVM